MQHLLSRLKDLGIHDIFGVAGDFAFPVEDAICADKELRWIGCCNELNAAYAADGYARVRGLAVLSTTYGVGELSAMNGIAGAFAENLPIFHIVGMPSTLTQASGRIVHHTLGNGDFSIFHKIAESVVCASAILSPENTVLEIERLIKAAHDYRKPVYIGIPKDVASEPIVQPPAKQAPKSTSDATGVASAVDAIMTKLAASKTACLLTGALIARCGLKEEAQSLIEASGLPFASMLMDKAVIDETHPNYIGMYFGQLMNEEVQSFIEGCDCVMSLGAMFTDQNTGYFTANIDETKLINVKINGVSVGKANYQNVPFKEILTGLASKFKEKKSTTVTPIPKFSKDLLKEPNGGLTDSITAEYLYPRWQQTLKPNDIFIVESGTATLGLGLATMPEGSAFHNQTLWGSIGWATPAAFGAALADPSRRVVLVTGEGAHQLTVQEVSQFHRCGLKPLIFVINNNGYLIERLLCDNPDFYYNDLAQWRYSKLPEAFGCEDWFVVRVKTCGELDDAIKKAESSNKAAYIEVITDTNVAPLITKKAGMAAKSIREISTPS